MRPGLAVLVLAFLTGVAHAEKITHIEVRENTKTTDKTVIQNSRLEVGNEGTAEKITHIEVRENTKTTDKTVIQISRLEVGDEWTAEKGVAAETELKSSNLFKDVLVAPEPSPTGVRVVIVAKDKHAWIVAPTFYDQP